MNNKLDQYELVNKVYKIIKIIICLKYDYIKYHLNK